LSRLRLQMDKFTLTAQLKGSTVELEETKSESSVTHRSNHSRMVSARKMRRCKIPDPILARGIASNSQDRCVLSENPCRQLRPTPGVG
jgi:hypothetical protein